MTIRMQWTDGKIRCHWVSPTNTTYLRYHDEEWGRPVHDDQMLFEMLILENFQAGLAWECILNKREAFRLSLIHISEPTRLGMLSRMPSSA